MEEEEKLKQEKKESIVKELTEEEKAELKKEIDQMISESRELKKKGDEELKSENFEDAIKSYTEGIMKIKKIRAKKILEKEELDSLINELVVPSNLNLSLIDLKQCEWDNLINHTSKVLFMDTKNTKARYRRCVGYINKQNFEKAQEDFLELKRQIGTSTEIKVLENMLNEKKKSSSDNFYKKMSKSLGVSHKHDDYQNKSCFRQVKDFFYNKIFCCCFNKRRKSKRI